MREGGRGREKRERHACVACSRVRACMRRIRATPIHRMRVSDLIDASSHVHMQGSKVMRAATAPMPDQPTPMLGAHISRASG